MPEPTKSMSLPTDPTTTASNREQSAAPATEKKKKKSKKNKDKEVEVEVPPKFKKPHIIVEYKGEIDEERVESISLEVDQLVDKFELEGQKFLECNSMIKRRRIENEILLVIERLRDIMYLTVKGDKRELDCIFGGNCVRIGKTFYLLEQLEEKMSEMQAIIGIQLEEKMSKIVLSDQRWKGIQNSSNSVKEVLESMGHFKSWRPDMEESSDSETSEDSEEELTEEERHERWVRKLLKIIPKKTLDDFKSIDDITSIEELLDIKVSERYQYRDWMIWSVHRVYLNDPTLNELSFSNMQMPLPTVDSKVAPKLVRAVAKNTYLERLYLQNSTLQSAEAEILAESLKVNNKLRELNIEGNQADISSLCALAECLAYNKCLEVFRIGSQLNMVSSDSSGAGLGSKFEETLGLSMTKNDAIVRIGVDLFSPNWRNIIDSKILRNIDRQKRLMRQKGLNPLLGTAAGIEGSSVPSVNVTTTSSTTVQQQAAQPQASSYSYSVQAPPQIPHASASSSMSRSIQDEELQNTKPSTSMSTLTAKFGGSAVLKSPSSAGRAAAAADRLAQAVAKEKRMSGTSLSQESSKAVQELTSETSDSKPAVSESVTEETGAAATGVTTESVTAPAAVPESETQSVAAAAVSSTTEAAPTVIESEQDPPAKDQQPESSRDPPVVDAAASPSSSSSSDSDSSSSGPGSQENSPEKKTQTEAQPSAVESESAPKESQASELTEAKDENEQAPVESETKETPTETAESELPNPVVESETEEKPTVPDTETTNEEAAATVVPTASESVTDESAAAPTVAESESVLVADATESKKESESEDPITTDIPSPEQNYQLPISTDIVLPVQPLITPLQVDEDTLDIRTASATSLIYQHNTEGKNSTDDYPIAERAIQEAGA